MLCSYCYTSANINLQFCSGVLKTNRVVRDQKLPCTSPYFNAVSKLPKSYLTGVCKHFKWEVLQCLLVISCFSLLTFQGISFLMCNLIMSQFYYILTGFQLSLICRTCLRINTTVQTDSFFKKKRKILLIKMLLLPWNQFWGMSGCLSHSKEG